jgi:hypothetical protein
MGTFNENWDGVVRKRVVEAAAPQPTHGYKVGDILCAVVSYNMTQVSFYKVTRLIGTSKVELVGLSQRMTGNGWAGETVPTDTPKSSPKIFSVKRSGSMDPGVKVSTSGVAYRWSGKPQFYNHLD